MQKTFLAIATTALSLSAPLSAQSQQEQLDERYNLALAAGYKALFLCGAIANAERSGATRSVESVVQWELTGVYSAIDPIVRTLDHRILRDADQRVALVEVDWAEDMPPRFAEASGDEGCRLAPIGLEPSMPETRAPAPAAEQSSAEILSGIAGIAGTGEFTPPEPNAIDRVFDAALGGKYGEGTRSTVMLVRMAGRSDGLTEIAHHVHGFHEKTPQRTWSVAKSIAATLVGVAVQKGQVDVNNRLVRDEWRWDARRQITIDHLLRMASGRYSDTPGNRTDPLYTGGSTVEETATDWPLIHKPGTVYRYANNDTLMAVKAITDRNEDFDPKAFFAAVGMDHTVAETDWAGDYILSSQVWTTAEDLATLGELHLKDGVLPDGTRVLPEGWLEYISAPSGPQPDGPFGYGAGWWLLNKSEGVPPDTIAAMGNRGQYLVIIPSMDLVIVRRGEDMVGTRFDIAAFVKDVISAVQTLNE